jgi:hypothetical protein
VINKEGDDCNFLSKSLVAAMTTQLFSYMARKGIQWGYVFVREAIIFLHIPDDPTTVRYHLSIPRLDFQDDDENRFHRTSIAQIFAMDLQRQQYLWFGLKVMTGGSIWPFKSRLANL